MFIFRFINKRNELIVLTSLLSTISCIEMSKKLSVDFEVYGIVQGVFFRKHTEKQATSLGLKGWCMNTPHGTVQGTMQGDEEAIKNMKKWLQYTGSPTSKIDKAEFRNEKVIKKFDLNDFRIRR